MSEANAVVAAFMEAFNAMDVDAIVGAFTDDAVYHNMPGPPVSGRSAIEAVIRGYLGLASEMDWQIAYQAEVAPGVVLNERLDRFRLSRGLARAAGHGGLRGGGRKDRLLARLLRYGGFSAPAGGPPGCRLGRDFTGF